MVLRHDLFDCRGEAALTFEQDCAGARVRFIGSSIEFREGGRSIVYSFENSRRYLQEPDIMQERTGGQVL